MATALEGGEGSASRPSRSLPPGKTRYPLYRKLGWPQGRSGQVRKISPLTGIRSLDRPALSQSLYRLRYPGTFYMVPKNFVMFNLTDGVALNLFKGDVAAGFPRGLCLFYFQMSRRGTRCVIRCEDTPEKLLSLISVAGQMRERKVPTT